MKNPCRTNGTPEAIEIRAAKLRTEIDFWKGQIRSGQDPREIARLGDNHAISLAYQELEAEEAQRATESPVIAVEIPTTVNPLVEATQSTPVANQAVHVATPSKAPIVPGCKCRNSDQPNPRYWLFTGQQVEIQAAQIELERLGISAQAKANGLAGVWKLILPKWVTGQLVAGAEARWQE